MIIHSASTKAQGKPLESKLGEKSSATPQLFRKQEK